MTRESKFRAWDKRNKCWSIGPLYIDEDGVLFEIYEGSVAYQTYMHKENVSEDHDVCWYTGLKDKNGVEIYEGDIVKGHFYTNKQPQRIIGKVVYPYCYFCIDGVGQYSHIMRIDLDGSYEVIGNIYENHELLEAK